MANRNIDGFLFKKKGVPKWSSPSTNSTATWWYAQVSPEFLKGNAPTKGVVPRHVRTWIIISPWHDSILNNAQNGVVVPIPTWTIWITRGVHQSWPCSICSASHLLLALGLLSYSLPLTTRIIALFATDPNKKLHYSLLVGGCNPTNHEALKHQMWRILSRKTARCV